MVYPPSKRCIIRASARCTTGPESAEGGSTEVRSVGAPPGTVQLAKRDYDARQVPERRRAFRAVHPLHARLSTGRVLPGAAVRSLSRT